MKLRVAALVLLLSACSGPAADQGLSKADYVAKAQSICTRALADEKAVKTPIAAPQLPAYVSKQVAIAVDATEQLAKLDPPAADRSDLQDKFLGPLQDRAQKAKAYAEDVAAASARNDKAALARLAQSPPTAQVDRFFTDNYGLSVCAGG